MDLHGDTLVMNFLTRSTVQIIDIAEIKFQNKRRTLSLNRSYIPALYGHVQCCGVWKSIRAATEWYPDPCEQVHILLSCFLKFLLKLFSNLRLGLLYRPNFSTEFCCMYSTYVIYPCVLHATFTASFRSVFCMYHDVNTWLCPSVRRMVLGKKVICSGRCRESCLCQ